MLCRIRCEQSNPEHECKLPFASLWALSLFPGLAGPGGVTDGWADDKEADLALFSEIGQPMIRKGLKSLPPGFQAPRQLGISREGSTSLPAHLTRSAVVPCSESPAPSPAPGVLCSCYSSLHDVYWRSELPALVPARLGPTHWLRLYR